MRKVYLLCFYFHFICLPVSAQTAIVKEGNFLEELGPGDTYTVSIRNYACYGGGRTVITVFLNEEGFSLFRRNTSYNKFRRFFKESTDSTYEINCLTGTDFALLKSFEELIRAKIKDPDKKCNPGCYSGLWSEISISLNRKTIYYPDVYGNLRIEQLLNYFCKNVNMQ